MFAMILLGKIVAIATQIRYNVKSSAKLLVL
jgi:hypothetical protein